MASRKCRRNNIRAPGLPIDLMLEIVARSDISIIVRCATTCKLLRNHILSTPFIDRVAPQTAPCIVANIRGNGSKPLTVLHPATPAAASFCRDHLGPFMSLRLTKLLQKYRLETSGGGLVVLTNTRHKSNICVYNPMTGQCTFLSKPPDTQSNFEYVLLTDADGIGCSFMLLFVNLCKGSIKVHTATSSSHTHTWEAVTWASHHHEWCGYSDHIVLHGGVVHWLSDDEDHILTYDVGTRTSGLVKLPPRNSDVWSLQLATSPDGNQLKLLAMKGFKIFVWLQLPTVQAHDVDGNWSLEIVIDTEEKLRSMCPDMPRNIVLYFEGSGKSSGNVVLLQVQGTTGCFC